MKSKYLICLFLYTFVFSFSKGFEQKSEEYILELSSLSDTLSFLDSNKEDIHHVRYVFNSDLFYGTAVQFKSHQIANKLIKQSKVVDSWPIHHHVHTHASIHKTDRHSFSNSNDTFRIKNKDTLQILTQRNDFQQLKSNGTGIKIGIIDTGVDYTHPALGGCFGKGCKVAYGYDLVGDNYDGTPDSIKERPDPIDSCPETSTSATGHGTFISGIIAAEDKTYNWTGVAPGATLGMWRVYGCNYSSSPTDMLIKAMEMAYKAGMNIINMSLGISGGWGDDILSVMADRLISKGVHVITASGNVGSSGIFLTASPASARNVIAVGSSVNDHVPGYILKISRMLKKDIEINYRTNTNSAIERKSELSIVATGLGFDQPNDACEPLEKDTRFESAALLIHHGDCDSITKIRHAKETGASSVIFYTNDKNQTAEIQSLSGAVLPVAFINHEDGQLIYDAQKHGSNVKARFTSTLVALKAPRLKAKKVAAFSTLGPTYDLRLKPELLAAGDTTFSTLPQYQGSYGFRTGTSFSTPYITGSLALLLANVEKSIEPALAKNILMNFATQVKKPISASPFSDSPIRQGAGIVDVVQAIKGYQQFHISPPVLSLNDSNHFEKEQYITIYNHQTDKSLQISLEHIPAVTATGYKLNNKEFSFAPSEPVGLYLDGQDNFSSVAELNFSNTSLVIPAGKSIRVRVLIQPPVKKFKKEWHVLYGGYISIRANGSSQAHVPYFGMIGEMKKLPIFDRGNFSDYQFPNIGLTDGKATLKPNETGEFYLKKSTKDKNTLGGPFVLCRLLTGTPILQMQILNDKLEHIGDVPMSSQMRQWMTRNTLKETTYSNTFHAWYWNGEYGAANYTLNRIDNNPNFNKLKSGTYKIRLRALRVFGDRNNKGDWDEWTSQPLRLHNDLKK